MAHQPNPDAREAILRAAQQKGCAVLDVDAEVEVQPGSLTTTGDSGRLIQSCSFSTMLSGEFSALKDIQMQLLGQEQVLNAAALIRACWQLSKEGWDISVDALRKGLAETYLPGRCEARRSER
eukprot:scaffold514078_cov42-Prasinocladus_malaysianus.AAC.1